jgi:hypothetical protein
VKVAQAVEPSEVVSGQLILEAIVQGVGTPDMDGKPYSEEIYQNQSEG